MSSTKQVAKQFREVFLDGKFIAYTNLKEQITDLNYEQANTKIGNLNTIALLVFHLNYYIAGVLQVLEGGTLDIRDKFSFDMSPIESEGDWTKLKDQIFENSEKFAAALEKMPNSKLSEPFVDEKYGNYYRNMHSMIEHGYYHLGQIVLIKKMVLANQKSNFS